jgi:hypothetical protein
MLTTERYAELLEFFGKRYDDEHAKEGRTPSAQHWMISAAEMLRTQAAKIEALQAEVEARKQAARYETDVAAQAIADFEAMKLEVEALRVDAERYQALRRGQKWSVIDGIGDTLKAEGLDEAIDDAAIKGEPA